MTQQEQNRIIEEIKKRISKNEGQQNLYKCPICGGTKIVLLHDLSVNVSTNVICGTEGNKYLPVATLVCTHCGFVFSHSLGVLNLMDIYNNERTRLLQKKNNKE